MAVGGGGGSNKNFAGSCTTTDTETGITVCVDYTGPWSVDAAIERCKSEGGTNYLAPEYSVVSSELTHTGSCIVNQGLGNEFITRNYLPTSAEDSKIFCAITGAVSIAAASPALNRTSHEHDSTRD